MKKFLTIIFALTLAFGLSAKNPIVGISGYTEDGSCEAGMTYINSIRLAGGVPLVIPVTSDDEQIAAIVNAIDALIMTGGEDFDPLRWYGEEPVRALGKVVPTRDEFDVKLVRAAVAKGIPVLGICRGEQLLAVAFGGALWQDIPSQVAGSYVKHNQSSTTSTWGTHSIKIEEGSTLSKILGGRTEAVVNSLHHQAVKKLNPGLRVAARSADGINEAVERNGSAKLEGFKDGGAMILGLQFHPECITNGGNHEFLPIFEYLVKQAK